MILALLPLLLFAGGCYLVTDFDDLDTTRRETFELPFRAQGEVPEFDILFVVDRPHSGDSLGPTEGDVFEGMPTLISGMDYAMGVIEEDFRGDGILHIGVISSDLGSGDAAFPGCDTVGDEGHLLGVDPEALQEWGIEGCGRLTEPFILVVNEEVTNMVDASDVPMVDVTVDHAVRCLVMSQRVKETECRIRQPLGAFRKALFEHHLGPNAGFLRSQAGLAVVFITTEDDCSAADPSLYALAPREFGPYTCFDLGLRCEESPQRPGVYEQCDDPEEGGPLLPLRDLHLEMLEWKPQSRMVVSVMAGPFGVNHPVEVLSQPYQLPTLKETCSDLERNLYGLPGVRLELFRRKFAENSVFHEICDPDVEQLYTRLAQKLAAQLTYRCMPFRPADMDGNPHNGLQVDCKVRDVLNPDTTAPEPSPEYPHCDQSPLAPTCWEVMHEETCQSGFKMVLAREIEPVGDYVVVADCAIDVTYEPPSLKGGM